MKAQATIEEAQLASITTASGEFIRKATIEELEALGTFCDSDGDNMYAFNEAGNQVGFVPNKDFEEQRRSQTEEAK